MRRNWYDKHSSTGDVNIAQGHDDKLVAHRDDLSAGILRRL